MGHVTNMSPLWANRKWVWFFLKLSTVCGVRRRYCESDWDKDTYVSWAITGAGPTTRWTFIWKQDTVIYQLLWLIPVFGTYSIRTKAPYHRSNHSIVAGVFIRYMYIYITVYVMGVCAKERHNCLVYMVDRNTLVNLLEFRQYISIMHFILLKSSNTSLFFTL